MAEVDAPGLPTDWSLRDRESFSARWNRANVLNTMRGASGAAEYRSIGQRAAFYDWFDQVREVQGHEVLWVGAAFIVASQVNSVENPMRTGAMTIRRLATGKFEDSTKLIAFAREVNKAIFDNVFPKLADVFDRGLRGIPIKGDEAKGWDRQTIIAEQFEVAHPIYMRTAKVDPAIITELAAMAAGADIFAGGGIAIGGALDFKGNIFDPQARLDHGLNVVAPFYRRFKAAIDTSRKKRQTTKPDPSAGGMVRAG